MHYRGLDVADRNVRVERADQEAGMDEISGGVDEANEGREEAEEDGDVFQGGRGLARVPVDHLGHEGFRRRPVGPRADEGAQRDRD